MHFLSFDKPVFSDEALTIPVSGPFPVSSTTILPDSVYFSDTEYKGTGKNDLDDTLWTVRFTYPDHVSGNIISTATGAVYDE